MNTITECQFCGQGLRLPENAEGKKARCPSCRAEFMVEGKTRGEPQPPPISQILAADHKMDHSAINLTSEDVSKILLATYSSIKSDLGLLGDLPYELANTVANVYFRYFELGVDSSPRITSEELVKRQEEHKSISQVISEFRMVLQKSTDQPFNDLMASCLIDVFRYRIYDAAEKLPIRRMIERKFRKNQDIPNLVSGLQLYKAAEYGTPPNQA